MLRAPYEIVRYDRAGKWYLEGLGEMSYWRKPLTLTEAVELAYDDARQIHLGVPGGKIFDARIRNLIHD